MVDVPPVKKKIFMMLIFRRKMRTLFKNLVMVLMIGSVAIIKHIFSLVKEKCAVKEPEEFRDNGLQIHGHTYEGKYEIL